MIIPKNVKLASDDKTQIRIHRIEEQRKQTWEILDLLEQYAEELTKINKIESNLTNKLQSWYTDSSIYSPAIKKLKVAIDHRIKEYDVDINKIQESIQKQRDIELDIYKPLTAIVTNYFDTARRYNHYNNKLVKLQTTSKKHLDVKKVKNGERERLLRNERKFENAKNDIDVYIREIIENTNELNLQRFERINPLVKSFTNIQVNGALRLQKMFMDIENFEQVFDSNESDVFNEKYFDYSQTASKTVQNMVSENKSVNNSIQRNSTLEHKKEDSIQKINMENVNNNRGVIRPSQFSAKIIPKEQVMQLSELSEDEPDNHINTVL